MNIRFYIPLLAGAVVLVSCLQVGAQPAEAGVVQPDDAISVAAEAGDVRPDHLEPIPAYDPDGYNQAVYKSLLGSKPAEGWMIGLPSFSPEYAVVLRCVSKYAKSQGTKSESWRVEYSIAKNKIYRSKTMKNGVMKLDIKVTDEVDRYSVEVSEDFVRHILGAWRSVLQETHYPTEYSGGLDGETFQFCCVPNLFGETWSPSSGKLKIMTDLGAELGELARSDEGAREAHLLKCQELADTLYGNAKKQ